MLYYQQWVRARHGHHSRTGDVSKAISSISAEQSFRGRITDLRSYFNQYALKKIYLPDPVHAKYINKSVLDRYMAVGGVRIEDDILITKTGWTNLTTAAKGEKALRIIRGEE